jgi:predicted metal-binding transcription factor (methanogenesis marker protein 9)
MLLVANLFRRAILFHGLGFCGRPVLICSTHVYRIVAPKPAVPSKHISTQHTFPKKKQRYQKTNTCMKIFAFLSGAKQRTRELQPIMLPRCGTLLT